MSDHKTDMILALVTNLQEVQNAKAVAKQITQCQANEIYELQKQIKEMKSQFIKNK